MAISRRSMMLGTAAGSAAALTLAACGGDGGGGDGGSGGNGGGGGDAGAIILANGTEPQNPLVPTNTNEVGGGRIVQSVERVGRIRIHLSSFGFVLEFLYAAQLREQTHDFGAVVRWLLHALGFHLPALVSHFLAFGLHLGPDLALLVIEHLIEGGIGIRA